MRPWTWPLALCLALSLPGAVRAQPASGHAVADQQFQQGLEARDRGDFARALELFRASQALEPGRGKLLNIAMCEEEQNLLVAAMKHFQELAPQLEERDE